MTSTQHDQLIQWAKKYPGINSILSDSLELYKTDRKRFLNYFVASLGTTFSEVPLNDASELIDLAGDVWDSQLTPQK